MSNPKLEEVARELEQHFDKCGWLHGVGRRIILTALEQAHREGAAETEAKLGAEVERWSNYAADKDAALDRAERAEARVKELEAKVKMLQDVGRPTIKELLAPEREEALRQENERLRAWVAENPEQWVMRKDCMPGWEGTQSMPVNHTKPHGPCSVCGDRDGESEPTSGKAE